MAQNNRIALAGRTPSSEELVNIHDQGLDLTPSYEYEGDLTMSIPEGQLQQLLELAPYLTAA